MGGDRKEVRRDEWRNEEREGGMLDCVIYITPPLQGDVHTSWKGVVLLVVEGGVCVYKKREEGVRWMYCDG